MDYTHYIAIDFGTAGSGFAYATRTNPDKPHVFNKWPGLTNEVYKTPTVLLIDPDGNLEAFGQEALNKYYNKRSLKFPDRFDDYYFFRNFKMVLYDKQVSTLCTCQFQVLPPCIHPIHSKWGFDLFLR